MIATLPLADQQCIPHNEGLAALDHAAGESLLTELDQEWKLKLDRSALVRVFCFSNYYETLAFVNAVGYIAHQQDHHPEMTVSYRQCDVIYRTHSVNAVTRNDFICAAKIDRLCLE